LNRDFAKLAGPAWNFRRVAEDVIVAAVLDDSRERPGEIAAIDGGKAAGRVGQISQ
jgi:hypothetical protein